jgi:hypothetical protein
MDPSAPTYKDPRVIFYTLRDKINAAEDYKFNESRRKIDLDPLYIESKTVQLGVRDVGTLAQWKQISRAAAYAHDRHVEFVVTRIRDQ